jgi:hypothetical protein
VRDGRCWPALLPDARKMGSADDDVSCEPRIGTHAGLQSRSSHGRCRGSAPWRTRRTLRCWANSPTSDTARMCRLRSSSTRATTAATSSTTTSSPAPTSPIRLRRRGQIHRPPAAPRSRRARRPLLPLPALRRVASWGGAELQGKGGG